MTRFGKITVIGEVFGKRRKVKCRCDCGTEKEIRLDHLRTGKIISCGCQRAQTNVLRLTTHGMARTRTYRIWRNMITRCHNENYAERHLYGGRGIVVCDRWRYSFENFLEDMGKCGDKLSIDRVDVDGNYEASNCRWATAKEQANNRRPRRANLGVQFHDKERK